MKWKTACCFIFLLVPSFNALSVRAENSASPGKAVSPELYNIVQQKVFIDQTLGATDPATLTEDQFSGLIMESVLSGTVPQIGSIIRTADGKITAVTGSSGTARGRIPKAVYEVLVDPIEGITASTGRYSITGLATTSTIAIGLQNTAKDFGILSKILNRANTMNMAAKVFQRTKNFILSLPFLKNTQQTSISALPEDEKKQKVPVSIRLFKDVNGNGLEDAGEKPVAWANVRITLKIISTEQELLLKKGTNTVQFKTLPENTKSAFELIREVQAGNVREISLETSGNTTPMKALFTEGKLYGENFPLKAKTSYTLTVSDAASILLLLTK